MQLRSYTISDVHGVTQELLSEALGDKGEAKSRFAWIAKKAVQMAAISMATFVTCPPDPSVEGGQRQQVDRSGVSTRP